MTDSQIVDLFWARDESAIRETESRYRAYLYTVAYNILNNKSDSEEALNDAYLGLWNSIPPQKPSDLRLYATKIIRRIALNCHKKRRAAKRVPSEYTLSLTELDDCFGGGVLSSTDENAGEEIARVMNAYLRTLDERQRKIFVCRYYLSDPILKIAEALSVSESLIYKELAEIRQGLRKALIKEGIGCE